MQHTRISTEDFAIWLAIIAAQWIAGIIIGGGELGLLRLFLFCEAAAGTVSAVLAKTIEAWAYFHSWLGSTILHEAFGAFLVLALINRVRARALPGRGSVIPVQLICGLSFAVGIYTSSFALRSLEYMPEWRIILSWDHAFWWAMCCMVCCVPFYAICVGATIPRTIAIALAGFSLYAASNAGFLAMAIARHRTGRLAHLSDFATCLTLLFWIYASRSTTARVCAANAALTIGSPQLELDGTEKDS